LRSVSAGARGRISRTSLRAIVTTPSGSMRAGTASAATRRCTPDLDTPASSAACSIVTRPRDAVAFGRLAISSPVSRR
jgi:hypothetical protein